MRFEKTILLLGLAIIIISFLGIPSSWKFWILNIVALTIVGISFWRVLKGNSKNKAESFIENGLEILEEAAQGLSKEVEEPKSEEEVENYYKPEVPQKEYES